MLQLEKKKIYNVNISSKRKDDGEKEARMDNRVSQKKHFCLEPFSFFAKSAHFQVPKNGTLSALI